MALNLQTLLEGIYSSVLEARRYVNAQHLKMFESYFDRKVIDDDQTGEKIEVYVPRLVAMASSKLEDGRETFEIYEAPQATLVPLSTLAIETLEIEFEAKLTNFEAIAGESDDGGDDDDGEDEGIIKRTFDDIMGVAGEVGIMMKGEEFESGAAPVKVKVTFRLGDPPEGVSLIQEQLLDYLRK